jgi:HD-GYP domain-containing protein (c-di-GMP phosphodiesterase class II)
MTCSMSRGTSPAASGPTQGAEQRAGWEPRPWAAHAVAVLVRGGPIALGTLAGWITARLLPRPSGLGWALWLVALAIVSNAVVRLADRYTRRLLPLSMLLRFSLQFPDGAPSRYAVSLRAGSIERLRKAANETGSVDLPSDLGEAATTALAMVTSLNRHDKGTRGHCERVRAYSEMLAEEMGLDRAFRERLRWGAMLHDMGKLCVPAEILNKAGRPTEEEWAILARHPAEGERILAPLAEWLGDAVHAAGQHHERWDGAGYPNRLEGEEISLSARIVAVADAFAVMTAARAYKKPLSLAVARQELTKNAGTQFDPAVVRAMLSVSVGRVSRAAGPLSSLGVAPAITSLLNAAPAIPAMISSGAAAAALSFGFATPSSPIEWGSPVRSVVEAAPPTTVGPTALALATPDTTAVISSPTTVAATSPKASLTFDGPTGAIEVGASAAASPPTTALSSAATTGPNAPTVTTVATTPPTTTERGATTSIRPGTSVPPNTVSTSVPPPSASTSTSIDPTPATVPSETKPPKQPPLASTTTTTPSPAETTPPATTPPDTKSPKGPPLVSTTTSPSAETVPPETTTIPPSPTKAPPTVTLPPVTVDI